MQNANTRDNDILGCLVKNWTHLSKALFGQLLSLDGIPRIDASKHQIVVGSRAGLWRIEGRAGESRRGKPPCSRFLLGGLLALSSFRGSPWVVSRPRYSCG